MDFLEFCDPKVQSLTDLFEYSKDSPHNVTYFDTVNEDVTVSYRELYSTGSALAGYLQNRGIEPGDKIAYFGTTNLNAIYLLQATLMAGIIPVMLPLPLRINYAEEFIMEIKRRTIQMNPKLVIVDDELIDFVNIEEIVFPTIKLQNLMELASKNNYSYIKPKLRNESIGILQFTSGTTGEPKAVALSHQNVIEHIKTLVAEIKADNTVDTVLSWVPLYHNMGFIGMTLLPLVVGANLVLAKPQEFIKDPLQWAKGIEKYKATITVGPDFAYGHLARLLEDSELIDLSSLRIALTGTSKVDPNIIRHFIWVAKRHNFNEDAICCAFGLTENTLAVTFPKLRTGLEIDRVDRSIMQTKYIAQSPTSITDPLWVEEFVVLGSPIEGTELRICDELTGEILKDRQLGEIQIRGSSMAETYYQNEVLTGRRYVDGWLKTGDLGYTFDSKVVVICKISDKITLRSQWFAPEEIENSVGQHPNIRSGNVVALQVPDANSEPKIIIIAETKVINNFDQIIDEIGATLRRQYGIDEVTICFIPAGTLPKTTSGKFQRNLTRGLYLTGKLPRLR